MTGWRKEQPQLLQLRQERQQGVQLSSVESAVPQIEASERRKWVTPRRQQPRIDVRQQVSVLDLRVAEREHTQSRHVQEDGQSAVEFCTPAASQPGITRDAVLEESF